MSIIHFAASDAINATPVSADTPLPVDIGAGVMGALDDDAETDPDAASATVASLLRGILTELQAQTVLLTTIAGS